MADPTSPARPRFAGVHILLVAPFDDAFHAHSALKRRALERLGCRVTAFDLLEKPGLLGRLRGATLHERIRRALDQASPDAVVVADAGHLPAATVAALRREKSAAWLSWCPCDMRALATLRDTAPAFDRLFLPGTDLVEALAGAALPPARYLPLACDPSVHRPMRARDQFRANVVFVGAATPRREALLSELPGFGLAIWGPGWRKTALRDYCRGELLPESDYVRAYAGASVGINIHNTASADDDGSAPPEASLNQRTFELAAIGVPQVVDWRRDLERHFEPGREVLAFRTPSELKAIVRELIHDPPLAVAVGAAARKRALAEHTYMHRMVALLEGIGGK
jgi:spore maturation protein CgeB